MKINIRRTISLLKFAAKKHAPTIMVIAGAAGAVTATVMACKATLELEDTLDECKDAVEAVKAEHAIDVASDETAIDISPEGKKAVAVQTAKNAITVAKLYAPAAAVGTASLVLIFGSNHILNKRNASLAAAYATLDSMFKNYRKNVVETYGSDVDKDMRYGIKHDVIEETIVDEKGKTKTVKSNVERIDIPAGYSDYAKFWDESMRDKGWDPNPEYSMMYLKSVEAYCNNLLKAQGYLFLNDVYKQLGFDSTIAGQSVGWIYDPEHTIGDNYIDFGLYNDKSQATRRFVNGLENVVLLDFNVDGDIIHDDRLKLWKF